MPIEIVFDMLEFQHVEPQNEKPPSFCFATTVQHAEITTHQVVEKTQRQLLKFSCLLELKNEFNLKVLAQYYSVPQSISPVLHCTTKY